MLTRIITALIGLPVFLYILYLGGNFINTLVFIMMVTGIREAFVMMKIKNNYFFGLLVLFSGLIFLSPGIFSFFNIYAIFVIMTWMYIIFNFSQDGTENKKNMHNVWKTIFIFSYVTLPLYHIILLRNLEQGFRYVVFMFLIIWATDSFAYFTGRAFGKNKMAPLISPKKTMEGALGGSLSAVLIALAVHLYFDIFPESSLIMVTLMVMLITVISQMGDLFESCLKRIYNIKDSGSLLPGHGGVLDRFDSTIFVAPVFYLLLQLL